jgi:transposase
MRLPSPLPPSAAKQLTQLLDQVVTKADYRRVLCVWLRVALGMPAAEIALALGWSLGTVHNLHSQYLHEGASTLVGCGRGGRRRELLTVAEEEKLLTEFVARAEQGDLTEVSAIWAALEQQVGQEVTKSTVYRLLERHDWHKLVPRPFHPDTSLDAQEAFKKSSDIWCAPRLLAKQDAVSPCD